jgi:hypothetical protein
MVLGRSLPIYLERACMSKHKTQDSRNIHSGTQPQVIRIKRLADNLNYGISTVKRAIQAGNIPTTKVGKKEPAVEVKYINKIKELISQDPELSSKRNIQKERKAWRNRISENVTVDIRDRNSAPFQTILFVGPTNSGKTYHGLEELCATS